MATQSASAKSKADEETSTDDIEAQLAQLREDLATLVESVTSLGKEKVGAAKSKATNQAEEAIGAVRDQASRIESEVLFRVRERPLVALGCAAAVGFVAAMLARR